MICDGIEINELMMPRAHQYQILETASKLRRPNRISARTAFNISNDVRDEAEESVLATGYEIANQIGIATAILTTPRRARPQRGLNLLRYAALRH